MEFNVYNDRNPPRQGTARRIYQALKAHGFGVDDLHYNPNCWGRGAIDGWGTWACSIYDDQNALECWCGWDSERGAYLQAPGAPFTVVWLTPAGEVDGDGGQTAI